MQVVKSIEALRAARSQLSGRVGLVPTMGALHAGHLALVEAARAANDAVIATIFINPAQFSASEDLSKYPRNLEHDLAILENAGVDLVFTPTEANMYPHGFQTWLHVTEVAQGLEATYRPEHFKGVATVVAKLFNLTLPQTAYFGQKDAQQVVVIKTMTRDLNFPLDIAVVPTVREADGLAMSSRNVYLSPEQRQAAGVLYQALNAAADAYADGERAPYALRQTAMAVLYDEPKLQPDYVSLTDARTLREQDEATDEPLLISMTARLGTTRLLDNMLLPAELNNAADLTRILGG